MHGMDDNKKKALAGALTQIERQFGKVRSCDWAILAWPAM
jgi:hypothetical protein